MKKSRTPRKALPGYVVVDIRALKGPDGTLDGDGRALLAATGPWVCSPFALNGLTPGERRAAKQRESTERDLFKHRRERLKKMLGEIDADPDRGPQQRRSLVQALWPSVQRLLAHRLEMDVMHTIRAEDRSAKWTEPSFAISLLEAIRARYWSFDPIREPVEQAIKGLTRFQREPRDVQRRILGPLPPPPLRLTKAGHPWLKPLNAEARQAIAALVYEDENTTLRQLVGLVYRPRV